MSSPPKSPKSPKRPAPIHHGKKQRSIFEPGDIAELKRKQEIEQRKRQEEEAALAAAKVKKERADSYRDGLYGQRQKIMGGREEDYDDEEEEHHHGVLHGIKKIIGVQSDSDEEEEEEHHGVLEGIKNMLHLEKDPYADTYEPAVSANEIPTTFGAMAVGVTLAGMLGGGDDKKS
ncbi:expressed unknown protein [Seminavis robusta]|uniref:Uncharacterized protein n=1 Tax=Seminavis robusta TaxID=568900 RepID=A0A9N8HZ74_9STRA|nr:expressed unknown protein [Seminavis robusta]|eukprot:Sro3297_g346330.1 n/a (175) ;mRNA; r:3860-4384